MTDLVALFPIRHSEAILTYLHVIPICDHQIGKIMSILMIFVELYVHILITFL